MKRKRNDRDAQLVVIIVAFLAGGMLFALRSRGPVRGVAAGETGVALLVERVAEPMGVWRSIVVHHSATPGGSAAVFDRVHRSRGWSSLGYHFVIGNGVGAGDGEIEVGPRWRTQQQGAHAQGMNVESIGVCLVGNFMESPPTERQMAALIELTRYLQQRFGIPRRRVFLHSEVSESGTLCPGELFPAQDFRAAIRN